MNSKTLLPTALAAALVSSSSAGTVAWITDYTNPASNANADAISLLQSAGHTVTVVGAGTVGGTLSGIYSGAQTKAQYLETFDVVIISRTCASFNFTDQAGWANLDTGVVNTNGFTSRGSRLGWFSGAELNVGGGAVVNPDAAVLTPAHPIFNGVALTESNTRANLFTEPFGGDVLSGVQLGTGGVGGGILVAQASANAASYTIATWGAGVLLGNGVNITANRRVYFALVGFNNLAETQLANTNGLTASGDTAFLNAVAWAAVDEEIPDADFDGLPDVWEIAKFGNTTSHDGDDDPDGDGHNNLAEYNAGSDPNNINSTLTDIDGDGFADLVEDQYFGNNNGTVELNDLGQSPAGDFDRDMVTNSAEITAGTLPNDARSWADADGDGMNDSWELAHGLSTAIDDSALDPDSDGSTNFEEHYAGSDPQNAAWSPTNALLKHRWSFTNNLADSVGGADAQLVDPDNDPFTGGTATQEPASVILQGGGKDLSDYVLLGNNLLSALQSGEAKPVTIELWASQHSVMNWSRLFSFGVNGSPGVDQELAMTWSTGTTAGNDRVLWNGRTFVDGTNAPYELFVPYHVVMTIVPAVHSGGAMALGARVTWYSAPASSSQDGGHPLFTAKGSFTVAGDLTSLADSVCTLGRSMFPDATARAEYDEMRIWVGALTDTERELFHLLGPDDINRADSDLDGFPDAWEIARFGNLTTAIAGVDSDGDGDDDDGEFTEESNPDDITSTIVDSDGDGLADLEFEMLYFNHLLWKGDEDTDNDFINNADEQAGGSDPSDPASTPDTDSDGLADGWEILHFGDIAFHDGTGNPDGDFDTNLTEYANLTDPNDKFSGSDSDDDGLPDYWETFYLGDFTSHDGDDDPDGDTVTNAEEFAAGTDPDDGTDFPDVNEDNIPDGHLLAASDGFGATSFNAGLNWDNAQAPAAGSNYLVYNQTLRTPDVDNAFTVFAGDKLVISTGALWLKGTNSTGSANYVLHFGTIRNAVSAPGPASVGGTIEVIATSELFANNGPLVVSAVVSGSADLNLTGTNPVRFTAANSYSGDITLSGTASMVVDGSLGVGPASMFNFAPAASGVSNSLSGTGSLALNGSFHFDLANASTTPGSGWTIVSTATATYDNAFTIAGFTPDGSPVGSRIWTDGTYEFSEATGALIIPAGPGYAGWAAANGLTLGVNDGAENNPDNDGYANVLEYQLNGDPLASDGNLVTATENATHLIFTFERSDLSETDSTLNFRWGSTLAAWNTVVIGATSSGPNANGVVVTVTEDAGASADYDLIQVQLPKSNEVDGKLFGRLRGSQP
jgi:hypothetical protein